MTQVVGTQVKSVLAAFQPSPVDQPRDPSPFRPDEEPRAFPGDGNSSYNTPAKPDDFSLDLNNEMARRYRDGEPPPVTHTHVQAQRARPPFRVTPPPTMAAGKGASKKAKGSKPDASIDKVRAIVLAVMQITISVVGLVLGVYFLKNGSPDIKGVAGGWVGVIIGYWLR